RIFAAHTVRPDVSGSASDQWAVQWYVIDPKVGDLQTTTVGGWQPEIVQAGRIGGGETDGDYYHPTIVVTQQGVCYIEYTYSDDTTWPQIRRVQLNNSYSATIPSSEVTLQTGPSTAYEGPAWVDYVDMQVDPEDPCSFWSVHTLVHDKPDPAQDPTSIDERDVWLFEAGFGCLNANLNGQDGVDLFDMALFSGFFATGARRVDMNADGQTDATDASLYQAAYDDQSQ
ncbi:MAG: hypothetical protein HRU13_07235, partial [Phycisphaerales bacterium]|nr:hypothetical protein [Phycisphaerales bacterium]